MKGSLHIIVRFLLLILWQVFFDIPIDFDVKLIYNVKADKHTIWRSRVVRPSAYDWKSCRPQKGLEGSNPSFSASSETLHIIRAFGFVPGARFCARDAKTAKINRPIGEGLGLRFILNNKNSARF